MEELGSSWTCEEETLGEVWQKVLYTRREVEALKMEADEQMRKHKDNLKRLIEILNTANKERDEVKDHLQKIFNKLIPFASPKSPVTIPIKTNSSIAESNSLSDAFNRNSHNSSPVDADTSPNFSDMTGSTRINFLGKTYNQQVYNLVPNMDPADAAIDGIAMGKILPQKGNLFEAVSGAGPPLQTLLVAGPLPRWRNPPPLQTFKILPCETDQKPAVNSMSRSFTGASASKRHRSN